MLCLFLAQLTLMGVMLELEASLRAEVVEARRDEEFLFTRIYVASHWTLTLLQMSTEKANAECV